MAPLGISRFFFIRVPWLSNYLSVYYVVTITCRKCNTILFYNTLAVSEVLLYNSYATVIEK